MNEINKLMEIIMTKNGITYIAGLLYKNGKEIGHERNGYLRKN